MSAEDRIELLVRSLDYSEEERRHLVRLMKVFAESPNPPDPNGDFPDYEKLKKTFLDCAASVDAEALEEAFFTLYAHLHMYEARYMFQYLYPHQLTIQYEISSEMVKIGKGLQEWLGISEERVEWVVGDVCDQVFEDIDFYYLYRPVRPETERGEAFYENLAEMLDWGERPVVIFSIADCLKQFLSRRFKEFYNDGHLTCFRST
jgi:rubrerythrin